MLTRREIISRTALVGAGVTLFGCTAAQVNSALSQVATDAQTLSAGLSGAMASLSTLNIPGLTPTIIGRVQTAIASVVTVANALSGATSTNSAQPLVQQLEGDVNAVVDALAGLPLPAEIELPLQAAAVLLPVIETAVGLAISQVTASARLRATAPMSAAQARAILTGAAK
jgi:hypothetical protein